jgi:hypothetical protein
VRAVRLTLEDRFGEPPEVKVGLYRG